jgi:hypothetical protein
MELIDRFPVARLSGSRAPAVIQLLAGDLAAIPLEHAVDALVVSAFPNSYSPDPGTVFASLLERGLDMREVARRKQEDERTRLGCWLSAPLPEPLVQTFHFTRVICFEPRHPDFLEQTGIDEANIEETVGYVFRCLNNFVIPDTDGRRALNISSVAMPLLATGNQQVPLDVMFPRLLQAAVFWLEEGLPIDVLKIVVYAREKLAVAAPLFAGEKSSYFARGSVATAAPAVPADDRWESRLAATISRDVIDVCQQNLRHQLLAVAGAEERPLVERLFDRLDRETPTIAAARATGAVVDAGAYDVFVSYSRRQEREVKELLDALYRVVPPERVFYDRTSIRPGDLWIKTLSDAVRRARLFVAVLSPDYSTSLVCWDEFQCAKLKEYTTGRSVIRTIRLYSEQDPPPVMGIYNYIDCAEGDVRKLRESAAALSGELLGKD